MPWYAHHSQESIHVKGGGGLQVHQAVQVKKKKLKEKEKTKQGGEK